MTQPVSAPKHNHAGANTLQGGPDPSRQWLPLNPLPTLGFVGVGNMGMGMLTRWRSLGGPAVVFDMDSVRMGQAKDLGAASVGDAAAVAAALPSQGLLVICVVNGDDCRDVLWGPQGAVSAMQAGQTVLLTPTLSPDDVCDFAKQLAGQGIHLIDSPMSGGPVRAGQGLMSLMVAGPTRADWWAVLQRLADPVFDLGDNVGDGAKTKLVNNLLAGINLVAAAQVMTMAQKMALDPARTLAVMARSSAQSWIASDRIQRVLDGNPVPQAHMGLLAKDTRLAVAAGNAAGVESALGLLAEAAFAEAMAQGYAQSDDSAMWPFMQTLAGVKGTQS